MVVGDVGGVGELELGAKNSSLSWIYVSMESTDSAKLDNFYCFDFIERSHSITLLGFGSYLPYHFCHMFRYVSRHQIPTWTWDGRVRCSTSLAAEALRSFIMFSVKPMEPLQRRDPFVCVSYMKDGTWVAWWIRLSWVVWSSLWFFMFYATSTCHHHIFLVVFDD